MPEYLAPDVYVEEIDTGSKPIEGVSTSTAAMIGVAERGPVNVPILVTSYGEFTRWFGEDLNPLLFNQHCYLPHAVEGFFANGGKRLFVVRVLDPNMANFAATTLFGAHGTNLALTAIIQPVPSAPATNTIYVANDAGLVPPTVPPTWVQIGDGSTAEFRQIMAVPARSDITLNVGLSFPHAGGGVIAVDRFPATAAVTTPGLAVNVAPGDLTLTLAGAVAMPAGEIIGLVTGGRLEYVIADGTATAVGPDTRVGLLTPARFSHVGGGAVTVDVFNLGAPAAGDTANLNAATGVGDSVFLVSTTAPFVAGSLVRVTDGNNTEVRQLSGLRTVALQTGAYGAYPVGSVVEEVATPLTGPVRNLTAMALAESNVLEVNDRNGLAVGSVIQIGAPADPLRELLTIRAVPNATGAVPDPGRIILEEALGHPKAAGVAVQVVGPPPILRTAAPATTIAVPVPDGALELVLPEDPVAAAPTVLRVQVGGRDHYHVVAAASAAITPTPLQLDANIAGPHLVGEAVQPRVPLFQVRALDQGGWGNRLRVATRVSDPPSVQSAIFGPPLDPTHLRLASPNGVEQGTVLRRVDAAGNVLSTHKVANIDRQTFIITLEAADPLPVGAGAGDRITSHEFDLDILLLRQPDPAVPTRANQVLTSETFPRLSLDSRHSRYIHRVIGATWVLGANVDQDMPPNPLRRADRRSAGGSWYVRVLDVQTVAAATVPIRLGPVPLVDVLPSGRVQPARLPLNAGNDAVGAIVAPIYIGAGNVEPELRTGMFALENEEEISIVACPGQIQPAIQDALITHCESMRYRFAVLDGPRPPLDSLNDAQTQRAQFDTKYAAFYHPWLLIPEPYPASLDKVADYPIPPSGHMLGIYARTDIERGVHKAPANEVVRGITGLQRRLNKSEHDILNPYPTNINVIRDFREQFRGIRVYGGRVITSDPDWKYVNVRRLLIFIEASINRGLQWVVFEPNAEPLWARVRRSIANFLTLVWRNGALEGTKVEEAFFVKCDRTTMTQTDIDSGRLICYVGVAPVKPAEFVIVRIGLWTAHADD